MSDEQRESVVGPGSGAGGGSAYDSGARQEEAPAPMPASPACTFCGGAETEMMNAFGSQLSVATYWCRACGSPFEFMKWRGEAG